MQQFDTIVIGLGAMGSAALYQLAKRGNRALGLDRFSPPHDYGSSHGESRIIRKAIGEGEEYVPLALRSYELWRDIEKETGRKLLTITGGLTMESRKSQAAMHGRADFLDRAIRCAEKFAIRYEILDTADIKRRFPQFAITDERAYFEFDTGYLVPERCIAAQLSLARQHGAMVQTKESVVAVEGRDAAVAVQTDRGTYCAEKIVISTGAWIGDFLPPKYTHIFKVYRQVMYWFDIGVSLSEFEPPRFPIFIWIFGTGAQFGFYGFPSLDGKSIKVATEQFTETVEPDGGRLTATAEERRSMHEQFLRDRLPGISNRCRTAVSCLYTMTPDANFVIDVLPQDDRILLASPCSGHGFKHSAAIGEALAEIVIDGHSKIDIESFGLKRFETP
jgi:sarcosine oxidase